MIQRQNTYYLGLFDLDIVDKIDIDPRERTDDVDVKWK